MQIPLDEVVYFDAITSTPSTGAAVDADAAPTFAVYEEATDTDIGVGGNMTKRTSLTGNYRGSFTASTANGFEVGKWYSVIVTGVVGSVTGKAVAKSFRIVGAEELAGYPKADIHGLRGDAQSAIDLKDFADTGYDPATHLTASDVTHINGTAADGVALVPATVQTIANNAISADSIAAAAVTKIQTGLATAAALTAEGQNIAAILADTNELQADWANGGRLDTLLDTVVATTLLTRQIVGNKHTVVEAPAGTFTISVRNDTDDATVRTIVYVPATGARTVS